MLKMYILVGFEQAFVILIMIKVTKLIVMSLFPVRLNRVMSVFVKYCKYNCILDGVGRAGENEGCWEGRGNGTMVFVFSRWLYSLIGNPDWKSRLFHIIV